MFLVRAQDLLGVPNISAFLVLAHKFSAEKINGCLVFSGSFGRYTHEWLPSFLTIPVLAQDLWVAVPELSISVCFVCAHDPRA